MAKPRRRSSLPVSPDRPSASDSATATPTYFNDRSCLACLLPAFDQKKRLDPKTGAMGEYPEKECYRKRKSEEQPDVIEHSD